MLIGSLFSGIGGLELGLERAGFERTAWQVESDPWCRAVLAKHWPDAARHEDVRAVGVHNLEPVDVICGGFPCQDVSVAGRGNGLAGERSGLWREMLRIVRELCPRVVVVENVPALQRRGLDDVAQGLRSSGYAVEATRIQASDVGAPHRRERLFVVAYADSDGRQEFATTRVHGHGQSWDDVARCSFPPPPNDAEGWKTWRADGNPEPGICRAANGVSSRMDGFTRRNRLKALGNSVVPQVAEVIGQEIIRKMQV